MPVWPGDPTHLIYQLDVDLVWCGLGRAGPDEGYVTSWLSEVECRDCLFSQERGLLGLCHQCGHRRWDHGPEGKCLFGPGYQDR